MLFEFDTVSVGPAFVFTQNTPWTRIGTRNEGIKHTQEYKPGINYSKDTVFIVNDIILSRTEIATTVNRLINDGYKVIVDSIWEAYPFHLNYIQEDLRNYVLTICSGSKNLDDEKVVFAPNFFWAREYVSSITNKLLNYTPKRINDKKFLMAIKRIRPHRDYFYEQIEGLLDDAIHSYVDRNIELPMDKTDGNYIVKDDFFDRNFNSDWYDRTYFSVVVETLATTIKNQFPPSLGIEPLYDKDFVFLTEKTFKPIMFSHPFLIFGTCNSIAHLKKLGFETFDHIFDHSYDNVPSMSTRTKMIIDQIKNFDIDSYNDPQTVRMCQHNKELFYDEDRVLQMVNDEIKQPVLEFVYG